MRISKVDTEPAKSDRASTFAENVSRLMTQKRSERGETISQFADRVGVDYGWLRRISTAGVRQTSSRTLSYLKRLAAELGVSDYRTLWEKVPETLDPDQVVALMKERHPREWALLVAWEWSSAGTNTSFESGDLRAEAGVKKLIDAYNQAATLPRWTVEQAARRCARWVEERFAVVRRAEAE